MFSTSDYSRVAAARALAAAAALATTGSASALSPTVVYRLIEQADRKNKAMSADPKRTLSRTLLQRRHFQVLRDAAAQVERAHQAELMREQQRLQEQIFNLRFSAGQQSSSSRDEMRKAVTSSDGCGQGRPVAIARPAHFNAALLRNKDSQGWPSNQWTVSSTAATATAAVPAGVPVPTTVAPVPVSEDYQEQPEEVTFESNKSSSVSAFEQEWMEVTSAASASASDDDSYNAPLPTTTCTITFSTTTTPSTTTTTTTSASFFGLPCGTAGLSRTEFVNQEQQQQQQQQLSSSSSTSKHSRIVAAPQHRGKRSACASSVLGSAKKIREDFEDDGENQDTNTNTNMEKEVRIGFASSPFQWQSLFDQSQLQQVLCN